MANEFKIKKGLIVEGASGGTVVNVLGSQGQLLSVTDNLSGSIFAVSDISGVPIFDVNSSGLSTFDGSVGIGLTSTTVNLEVKSIQDSSFDEGIGVVRSNTSQTGYINMVGGAMNINAPNAVPIKFRDGGNTNLTIGGDGHATFAGTITITGTNDLIINNGSLTSSQSSTTNPVARFTNTDVNNYDFTFPDNSTLQLGSSIGTDLVFKLLNAGAGDFNLDIGGGATFAAKATSLATAASDGSTTLTTKSYVDGLVTGVPVYKGTWAAGTTGVTSAAISGTTITLTAAPAETIAVGDVVTADGITEAITVTAVGSQTSVTVNASVTIASGVTVTFSSSNGGYPDLTLAAAKVLGNYYIVSTAGIAAPNGSGVEPDSWAVGDWCIFSDVTPGTGTDLWQRIDNSSVISGAGTGGKIPLWEGATNADSETLGNAPITVSGNNTTFAGTGNFLGTAATGAALVTIENNSGSTATSYGLLVKGGGNSSSGKTFEVRDDSGNTDFIITGDGYSKFNGVVETANGVRNANGTEANPSYTFESDIDLGMYRVGANSLGFSTGGDNRLTINSSGNATFAGTIDSGAITTTGNIESTATSFVQSFNVADNSTFFNINHTGNEAWAFKCESIGGTNDAITIGTSAGTIEVDEAGQIFSHQKLDVATAGGRLTGKSNRGYLASIHLEQVATGADGGEIYFMTAPNGTTAGVKRMVIGSSGDVKITTNGKFLQGVRNTSSSVIDMIGFGAGTDRLQIKGGTSGEAESIAFFDTAGQMATFYNSNFGIGTTGPTGKLEIQRSQVATQFDRDCFLRLHPSATTDDGGFTNMFFGTSTTNNYGVAIGGKREGTGDGEPTFAIRMLDDSIIGIEVLNIGSTGAIKFNAYNSTNNTGTPTYLLGTDASGNVVKTLPYVPPTGTTQFFNQSSSYNNSTPGVTGYGNVSMDTSVSYYDTGKQAPAGTNWRGIVWTGKHYIITGYISNKAFFVDNNFNSITNPEASSITLPLASGLNYPHGGGWDGRYLYCIQYNPGTIVVYDLDNGTTTATIVNTQALSNTSETYDIEYAEGHLYTCADGKVSKYKVEGKTITHVFTSGNILSGIEAQAITYDGSYLWITQNGANAFKVSLDCVLVATITTGLPPNNIGWAWNGQNIATVNYSTGDIYIINTAETRFDTEKFLVMGGDVGIGTTSPGAKLEINDGSTQTELRISVTGDTGYSTINFSDASDINPGQIYYHHQQNLMNFRTNDSDRMVINSSGNVGINTTSPQDKLEVKSGYIRLYDPSSNINAGYPVRWSSNNGGTNVTFANISGVTTSAGNRTGDIYFSTSNSGAPTEKMRITSGGNVGIGVTSPTSKLTVGNGDIELSDSSYTNVPQLKSTGFSGGGRYVTGAIKFDEMNAFNGEIQFWTTPTSSGYANANANHAQRMVINKDGNVGIGTTTPLAKLDIQGTQGQLFSVTDDLSGSLFAVADISGVPIFDVDSSGIASISGSLLDNYTLNLGTTTNGSIIADGRIFTYGNFHAVGTGFFGGNVGIGATVASSSKLTVYGGGSTTSTLELRGGASGADNSTVSTQQSMTFQIGSAGATGRSFSFNKGGLGYGNGTNLASINSSGTFTATGDVIAYSDERLKSNIKTLDGSKVYKMRGVSFIKDNKKGSGVIAQEIKKIAPELVNEESEYLGVAYGNLSGYLIEAIKELKAEIEDLKKKIK